jgi:hypothetical protein
MRAALYARAASASKLKLVRSTKASARSATGYWSKRLRVSCDRCYVVWVAQKQHEDAVLHHDFGGKLHMQTCTLGLVQRHHLPIGSVRPDTHWQETSSNSDSCAAARAAPG